MSIPKVIALVVNNDLCTGCGLCTYKCAGNALKMDWNDNGFLVPYLAGDCQKDGACLSVCPFNPFPANEVRTETELAEIFQKETTLLHPEIGKYEGIYAGYADEFRATSSSGGVASFVLTELLERGIVHSVFSVRESVVPGSHYAYSISRTKEEVLVSSKTKYFPVTLATVFREIDKLDGPVAITGVACFIKAIRLAQYSDPLLKKKIPFLVGIICGGIKSRFFTEYLAAKAGVPKELCYKPDFRIKNPDSTASDYSFGCINKKENSPKYIRMRSVGDMWGTGLFKANACDFCDDVTTELADISLGDAWLSPFDKDGKGNNVIVTRSELAESIIREGIDSGKLLLESLPLDRFRASQQGSFNHRHMGLPFRMNHAKKKGLLVPPKRDRDYRLVTPDFKLVQYLRMLTRRKSLAAWKQTANVEMFDKRMKTELFLLRKSTYFYHVVKAWLAKRQVNKK